MARRLLDTSILYRSRTGEDARRARKLENIYHAGQDKIWDGRAVLAELVARHGPITVAGPVRRALQRVFSALMWGELAAWKISAQLADALEDLEAKMAATSQVHDEARHFYVFHDYLALLGGEIPEPDAPTRMILETVLATDSLVEKVVGMQLFVESMALTIFKAVREHRAEPVLTDLLAYFERDEARHVGLGVQHVPHLVRGLGRRDRLRLDAFQIKILLSALASLKLHEASFQCLGVDPRSVAEIGRQKMVATLALLAEANGEDVRALASPAVTRVFDASCELLFPEGAASTSLARRLREAGRAFAQPAQYH